MANLDSVNAQVLLELTVHLMDSKCTDLATITLVDKLCRRNWHGTHRGWMRWAYYVEGLLGSREAYNAFAKADC
jgi:hypothetical protein